MPGKVKTPVQGSRWTLPLLALTFMIGAFGCGPVAEPDGPALEYRSREAGEDGFAGLPVVQMAYVCNESYELCLFEDGGFDEGIGLEDTPPTQFNGEVPLVPQAEYVIDCVGRAAGNDTERAVLGDPVRECHFLLTLAAYPVDGHEVRRTGIQSEPIGPPGPGLPPGAVLPPAAYPPGPTRTIIMQTVMALPTRADYEFKKKCIARPPINDDERTYRGRVVRQCGTLRSSVVPPPPP